MSKDVIQKTKEQKLNEVLQGGSKMGCLGRVVHLDAKAFTYEEAKDIATYIGEKMDMITHIGAPIRVVGDLYIRSSYSIRVVPETTSVPLFVFILLS